jgi:hypothetical protein|uniref:Hypothetical chloroplast RF20 n=1 Tax=Trebouxiophyceae sp. MX-AZ01 TaxID=1208065 RepID=J7KDP8_9CHLO|nr:hypothetical chloroplast RF20 [Trebouxiophyceae sp. MX-AZ01]AFQ93822.1 hypothetical chloroplast RF20 [Trebouxiophyceae sp. MX-AZ01]
MATNFRLETILRQASLLLQRQIGRSRLSFSAVLFSLLLGFVAANLFGTALGMLRKAASWDGMILLGLIVLIEATNHLAYCPPSAQGGTSEVAPLPLLTRPIAASRLANSFKVGVLLGFFVEAFKVGS